MVGFNRSWLSSRSFAASAGVVALSAGLLSSVPGSAPPLVGSTTAQLTSGNSSLATPWSRGRAKNVIFIQGDGMGIAHRELIRLATVGQNGDLAMNKMDYAGLIHTDSADPEEAVTDSAAAATAYSTGVRTFNGAIGVDLDSNPVPTLLERARQAGKSTGLVTTSQVTDATPAAFGAHISDRAKQSEIARQFLEVTKPDVILGGGEDFWFPAGNAGGWPDNPAKDPTEQSKGTQGNLVEKAQDLGYRYVRNGTELGTVRSGKVLGLFANEEMFEHRNEGQGDLYEPSVPLRDMASKALDAAVEGPPGLLPADRGGGHRRDGPPQQRQADHQVRTGPGRHGGDGPRLRQADAADPGDRRSATTRRVGWRSRTSADDIENGAGETAEDGPIKIANSDLTLSVDWTTDGHTGAAVPVTAQGPGAERFARIQRNTDVHDSIARAMGVPR